MDSVDAYLAEFPEDVQAILEKIRKLAFELAPDVEERIAYGMPSYYLNKKPLFYFAAYKNHIGLYAFPVTHAGFEKELKSYKRGKGSVQFKFNEEMPYDLIARMIKFRISENSTQVS